MRQAEPRRIAQVGQRLVKDGNVARRREGIERSSREARQPSQHCGVQGRRCDPMLEEKTIDEANQ